MLLLSVQPHLHLAVASGSSDAFIHLGPKLVGNIGDSFPLSFALFESTCAHICAITRNLFGLGLKLLHFGLVHFHGHNNVLRRERPECDVERNAHA
jgi:hypothetical protein